MSSSSDCRTAEQPFSNQFVHCQDESADGPEPERECGRWQDLFDQADERIGRALFWCLVEKPPEEHGEMHEIEHTAQSGSQWRRRGIGRIGNRTFENLLDAQP